MKKNKTEEIEFIIDENNRVDFRQVLQMINMYEEKIQKKQAIFDKAIDYIENKVISSGEVMDQLRKVEVKELLNILKEAQNEKN